MSDVSPRIMRSRVFEIFLIIRRQLKSKNHISLRLQISTVFHFKIKYTTAIFMPEPQFSQHKARNQVEIFLVVFFFYEAMFNTNNKCGFLTYILTQVSNFKTYDGTRDHTYKTTTRKECVYVSRRGCSLDLCYVFAGYVVFKQQIFGLFLWMEEVGWVTKLVIF